MYHDFIVPETGGAVLLGEVSMCNDDEHDNCFYAPIGRFPEIEEDEKPYRLLCTEYPKAEQARWQNPGTGYENIFRKMKNKVRITVN